MATSIFTTETTTATVDDIKKNCTLLDRSYSLWYHSPELTDWSPESYNEILTFNTLQEFWFLDKFIKKDMVENGMFFVMIDGVLPIWEDKNNIQGGCVSWKVDRKFCYKYWIDCVGHFIMKNLGNFNNLVNGISISPKKNSSIIKLWFKEEVNINNMKLPDTFCMVNDKVIYKSHVQNIDKDKIKKSQYQ